LTGIAELLKDVTSFTADDAVNATVVPVSADAEIVTTSPESTVLSAGTFAVAGDAELVALVTPFTVTESGAALATEVTMLDSMSAAALINAIFLNELIYFFLLFLSVFF
jgi:hypothetical protein